MFNPLNNMANQANNIIVNIIPGINNLRPLNKNLYANVEKKLINEIRILYINQFDNINQNSSFLRLDANNNPLLAAEDISRSLAMPNSLSDNPLEKQKNSIVNSITTYQKNRNSRLNAYLANDPLNLTLCELSALIKIIDIEKPDSQDTTKIFNFINSLIPIFGKLDDTIHLQNVGNEKNLLAFLTDLKESIKYFEVFRYESIAQKGINEQLRLLSETCDTIHQQIQTFLVAINMFSKIEPGWFDPILLKNNAARAACYRELVGNPFGKVILQLYYNIPPTDKNNQYDIEKINIINTIENQLLDTFRKHAIENDRRTEWIVDLANNERTAMTVIGFLMDGICLINLYHSYSAILKISGDLAIQIGTLNTLSEANKFRCFLRESLCKLFSETKNWLTKFHGKIQILQRAQFDNGLGGDWAVDNCTYAEMIKGEIEYKIDQAAKQLDLIISKLEYQGSHNDFIKKFSLLNEHYSILIQQLNQYQRLNLKPTQKPIHNNNFFNKNPIKHTINENFLSKQLGDTNMRHIIIDNVIENNANTSNINNPSPKNNSISDLRTGLFRGDRKDSLGKALLENILPATIRLGKALDRGDCFFDAIAQSLKSIDKGPNTAKELREICFNYVFNLEKESKGSKDKNWIYQRFLANAKRLSGNDSNAAIAAATDNYQQYMANIRFTADEKAKGFGLNATDAIWGEQDIDGRILREKLNINFHVIEILDSDEGLIAGHQLNGKSIEDTNVNYQAKDTIHIAVFNNHFVPLLPKSYNVNLDSSTERLPSFNKLNPTDLNSQIMANKQPSNSEKGNVNIHVKAAANTLSQNRIKSYTFCELQNNTGNSDISYQSPFIINLHTYMSLKGEVSVGPAKTNHIEQWFKSFLDLFDKKATLPKPEAINDKNKLKQKQALTAALKIAMAGVENNNDRVFYQGWFDYNLTGIEDQLNEWDLEPNHELRNIVKKFKNRHEEYKIELDAKINLIKATISQKKLEKSVVKRFGIKLLFEALGFILSNRLESLYEMNKDQLKQLFATLKKSIQNDAIYTRDIESLEMVITNCDMLLIDSKAIQEESNEIVTEHVFNRAIYKTSSVYNQFRMDVNELLKKIKKKTYTFQNLYLGLISNIKDVPANIKHMFSSKANFKDVLTHTFKAVPEVFKNTLSEFKANPFKTFSKIALIGTLPILATVSISAITGIATTIIGALLGGVVGMIAGGPIGGLLGLMGGSAIAAVAGIGAALGVLVGIPAGLAVGGGLVGVGFAANALLIGAQTSREIMLAKTIETQVSIPEDSTLEVAADEEFLYEQLLKTRSEVSGLRSQAEEQVNDNDVKLRKSKELFTLFFVKKHVNLEKYIKYRLDSYDKNTTILKDNISKNAIHILINTQSQPYTSVTYSQTPWNALTALGINQEEFLQWLSKTNNHRLYEVIRNVFDSGTEKSILQEYAKDKDKKFISMTNNIEREVKTGNPALKDKVCDDYRGLLNMICYTDLFTLTYFCESKLSKKLIVLGWDENTLMPDYAKDEDYPVNALFISRYLDKTSNKPVYISYKPVEVSLTNDTSAENQQSSSYTQFRR